MIRKLICHEWYWPLLFDFVNINYQIVCKHMQQLVDGFLNQYGIGTTTFYQTNIHDLFKW